MSKKSVQSGCNTCSSDLTGALTSSTGMTFDEKALYDFNVEFKCESSDFTFDAESITVTELFCRLKQFGFGVTANTQACACGIKKRLQNHYAMNKLPAASGYLDQQNAQNEENVKNCKAQKACLKDELCKLISALQILKDAHKHCTLGCPANFDGQKYVPDPDNSTGQNSCCKNSENATITALCAEICCKWKAYNRTCTEDFQTPPPEPECNLTESERCEIISNAKFTERFKCSDCCCIQITFTRVECDGPCENTTTTTTRAIAPVQKSLQSKFDLPEPIIALAQQVYRIYGKKQ